MTPIVQKELGWVWTAGATSLLLAVGGLIFQVRELSSGLAELREKGSPILKARQDVSDSLTAATQRQVDALTLEIRSDIKDVKRLLEEHLRKETKP